jgi:hypothetical protein
MGTEKGILQRFIIHSCKLLPRWFIWRHNMGTACPQGDGTGWDGTHFTAEPDGIVDIRDYEFWRANFAATYGMATGSTNTVPEPLSVHLFLFGIVMMIGQITCDRLDRRVS